MMRNLHDLAAAVSAQPDALLPILVARASVRTERFSERPETLPSFAWRAGYALAAADHVLEQLNAPWYRVDRGPTDTDRWLAELREGLDAYARICWCLRFGYTLAGVALARWFLERWTYNIAFSYDIGRTVDEDDGTYINRVWARYPHVTRDVDVSANWASLSELLHGRRVRLGASEVTVGLGMSAYDRLKVHNFVIRAAEVPLRQVRGCVSVLASENGISPDSQPYLQAPVRLFAPAPTPPEFLSIFFEPVSFDFVTSNDSHTTTGWGETYRRIVRREAAGPLKLTGFHSWMSIEERWARTADEARTAFDAEAARTAGAFDPANLRGLLGLYQAITEMTELVACQVANSPQAEALRSAASALESAWVLWLQDVDESLIAMRCVLESTARARTHRTKPDRAKRLESRGSATTPHRWIEAAGWARLAPFARALGEFSHMQERSRHSQSRALLAGIQRHAITGLEAHTARASALEEIARMLAYETAETVDQIDPQLGAQFRARILFQSETETKTELAEWLDHALRFRPHDFGQGNYPIQVPDVALTTDQAARVGAAPPLDQDPREATE